MFDEKEKAELDLLVGMGKRQAGKLSSMIISNCFVGFPTERQTEDTYMEMVGYLERSGIEIIDDGSEIEAEDPVVSVPEIRPFDPSKIDIDMKTMELSSITERSGGIYGIVLRGGKNGIVPRAGAAEKRIGGGWL